MRSLAKLTDKPRRRAARLLAGVWGGLLLAGTSGRAAEIFVGTEYRYPTAFEVTPVTSVVIGPNGVATTQIGGLVTPTDFETRLVGVSLAVEATVVDVTGVEAAALHERGRNGNTALMVAAATGDELGVEYLLARGGGAVNRANHSGSTALMGASAGGFEGIVARLIRRGAQVGARSRQGFTALMFAARNGYAAVAQRLLAAGAGVDAVDNHGQTALLYAVDGGHLDVARLLAAAGANVNHRNRQGVTPLALASRTQHQELVVLLTRCGARQ